MKSDRISVGVAGATPGWMVVRVGDTELALPIERVGEVIPVPEMSPVPTAPSWVAGIISVRGEVVPVVDLGMRVRGQPADREGRLVLAATDHADERVGLIVDAVVGLIDRIGATVAESEREASIPERFASGVVTDAASVRRAILDLTATLDPSVAESRSA